jgi:hypothetical protein
MPKPPAPTRWWRTKPGVPTLFCRTVVASECAGPHSRLPQRLRANSGVGEGVVVSPDGRPRAGPEHSDPATGLTRGRRAKPRKKLKAPKPPLFGLLPMSRLRASICWPEVLDFAPTGGQGRVVRSCWRRPLADDCPSAPTSLHQHQTGTPALVATANGAGALMPKPPAPKRRWRAQLGVPTLFCRTVVASECAGPYSRLPQRLRANSGVGEGVVVSPVGRPRAGPEHSDPATGLTRGRRQKETQEEDRRETSQPPS